MQEHLQHDTDVLRLCANNKTQLVEQGACLRASGLEGKSTHIHQHTLFAATCSFSWHLRRMRQHF